MSHQTARDLASTKVTVDTAYRIFYGVSPIVLVVSDFTALFGSVDVARLQAFSGLVIAIIGLIWHVVVLRAENAQLKARVDLQ